MRSQLIVDTVLLAVLGIAVFGFYRYERRGRPRAAWAFLFGVIGAFIACFAVVSSLVAPEKGGQDPQLQPASYASPSYVCTPGDGSCERT